VYWACRRVQTGTAKTLKQTLPSVLTVNSFYCIIIIIIIIITVTISIKISRKKSKVTKYQDGFIDSANISSLYFLQIARVFKLCTV